MINILRWRVDFLLRSTILITLRSMKFPRASFYETIVREANRDTRFSSSFGLNLVREKIGYSAIWESVYMMRGISFCSARKERRKKKKKETRYGGGRETLRERTNGRRPPWSYDRLCSSLPLLTGAELSNANNGCVSGGCREKHNTGGGKKGGKEGFEKIETGPLHARGSRT